MSTQMSDFDDLDTPQDQDQDQDQDQEQQRQPVSVVHLVMGLVFLGIAGSWALHAAGVIGSVDVEWLIPLVLVVAGAAGLLASVARGSRRGTTTSD